MSSDYYSNRKIRERAEATFAKSMAELNIEQAQAVDMIDGPVMVIAGPGTGKTQILAMRVANILQKTDAKPYNILCLTFTDSASISMRNRLVKIIGPAAHQIHIYTFHSFCNQVIQENLGIFGDYRQLEPLSDLERVDVFQEIMDGLDDDHILKKLKTNQQYEINRLKNLFNMMKKENLTPPNINERIDEYLNHKEEDVKDKKLFYQRKYKQFAAGDKKPDAWNMLYRQMNELKAGAALLDTYRSIMHRLGRYDYQDMILWVLERFENDDYLLSRYQEQYLYFLVDEYQDTNGAQNALLRKLISYHNEKPDVFVVGDDDQAIYKFQGANLDNIKQFKTQYQPQAVVLQNNYRSTQTILDIAQELIRFNTERIVNDDPWLVKNLKAAKKERLGVNILPEIRSYPNVIHEQAALVEELTKRYDTNEDMSSVAVLYRKHSQIDKLVEVLEKKSIPLNIKRKVDILKLPLIKNILNILHYINEEHYRPNVSNESLFELMHYRFFHISSHDIAKLNFAAINDKNHSLRDIMGLKGRLQELEIKSISEILRLDELLDNWVSDISNVTLQVLFEKIINEGQILKHVLTHPDKTWLLQVLSTFFDLLKEETSKHEDMKLGEFLEMIEKMYEYDIPLPINKIVQAAQGIHFMTAHASKGMEFDTVYIPGITKGIWDESRGNYNQFKYPDNVNADVETNIEDERRLLFVAMTRTERQLIMSYGLQKENGKEVQCSQFIDEIVGATDLKIDSQHVKEELINDFQYHTLWTPDKPIELIDHDLIDRILEKYKLSVTGLNKYLQCPLTFYFETILQVPTARNKYMGFGRAIHKALEDYFDTLRQNLPVDEKLLLRKFHQGMKDHRSHFSTKDWSNMNRYGELILPRYYNHRLSSFDGAQEFGLEIKIDNVEFQGIPIKGILDRVDIYDDHIEVTDYKTGKFKNAKKKLYGPRGDDDPGGDYWRQIVFYKILVDADSKRNWNMNAGTMDFVEPDDKSGEFFHQKIVLYPEHIRIVGDQIKDTWQRIHNHEFHEGCGEEHCRWCRFVRNEYVHLGEWLEEDQDIPEVINIDDTP